MADDEILRTRTYFNTEYRGERAKQPSPIQRFVFESLSSLIPPGRPDETAVDLGCHWGSYTRFLARTYGKVWGLDCAAAAVDSAPRVANTQFAVMDLESPNQAFPFDERVALFVAIGLFELLRRPEDLCRRLGMTAAGACRVFIVVPNRRSVHFWFFRLSVWIARTLLGRRSLYIYNNGVSLSDLTRWLAAAGFKSSLSGAAVGLPPSVLERLPGRVQEVLLPLDGMALRFLGGSYHWAILEKERSVASVADR